jgi:hypothetical protein
MKVEYLLELTRALRDLNVSNPHVFEREKLVLSTKNKPAYPIVRQETLS